MNAFFPPLCDAFDNDLPSNNMAILLLYAMSFRECKFRIFLHRPAGGPHGQGELCRVSKRFDKKTPVTAVFPNMLFLDGAEDSEENNEKERGNTLGWAGYEFTPDEFPAIHEGVKAEEKKNFTSKTEEKYLWYENHHAELVRDLEPGSLGHLAAGDSVLVPFGRKTFPVALNKYGDVTVAAGMLGEVIHGSPIRLEYFPKL